MTSPVLPKPHPAHQPLRTDGATGEGHAKVATPPSTTCEGHAKAAAPSTTPGPLASFVRFVVCGGGIGLLSGAAVPLLATLLPWALANAVITLVSTLVCTELHALFTFGTGRRAGWHQHLQSAGSATAAYGVTCAAMFLLYAVHSSPGLVTQQVVYLGAAALAGTGRFLVLRLFVFADRTRKGTAAGAERGAAVGAGARRGTAVGAGVGAQPGTTVGVGARGGTTEGVGARCGTTVGVEGGAAVPTAAVASALTRPVLAVAC
ncbi:hypothetical protein [Streptomyces phaeoluteigriseus]|uniref:hypothetical protein n=1 Tax=Streptomyces phaeoluteigriseus TaxID=114686 RepID=UPI0036CF332A